MSRQPLIQSNVDLSVLSSDAETGGAARSNRFKGEHGRRFSRSYSPHPTSQTQEGALVLHRPNGTSHDFQSGRQAFHRKTVLSKSVSPSRKPVSRRLSATSVTGTHTTSQRNVPSIPGAHSSRDPNASGVHGAHRSHCANATNNTSTPATRVSNGQSVTSVTSQPSKRPRAVSSDRRYKSANGVILSEENHSWTKLDLFGLNADGEDDSKTEIVLSLRQTNILLSPRVYDPVKVSSQSHNAPNAISMRQSHDTVSMRSRLQQVTIGPLEMDESDMIVSPRAVVSSVITSNADETSKRQRYDHTHDRYPQKSQILYSSGGSSFEKASRRPSSEQHEPRLMSQSVPREVVINRNGFSKRTDHAHCVNSSRSAASQSLLNRTRTESSDHSHAMHGEHRGSDKSSDFYAMHGGRCKSYADNGNAELTTQLVSGDMTRSNRHRHSSHGKENKKNRIPSKKSGQKTNMQDKHDHGRPSRQNRQERSRVHDLQESYARYKDGIEKSQFSASDHHPADDAKITDDVTTEDDETMVSDVIMDADTDHLLTQQLLEGLMRSEPQETQASSSLAGNLYTEKVVELSSIYGDRPDTERVNLSDSLHVSELDSSSSSYCPQKYDHTLVTPQSMQNTKAESVLRHACDDRRISAPKSGSDKWSGTMGHATPASEGNSKTSTLAPQSMQDAQVELVSRHARDAMCTPSLKSESNKCMSIEGHATPDKKPKARTSILQARQLSNANGPSDERRNHPHAVFDTFRAEEKATKTGSTADNAPVTRFQPNLRPKQSEPTFLSPKKVHFREPISACKLSSPSSKEPLLTLSDLGMVPAQNGEVSSMNSHLCSEKALKNEGKRVHSSNAEGKSEKLTGSKRGTQHAKSREPLGPEKSLQTGIQISRSQQGTLTTDKFTNPRTIQPFSKFSAPRNDTLAKNQWGGLVPEKPPQNWLLTNQNASKQTAAETDDMTTSLLLNSSSFHLPPSAPSSAPSSCFSTEIPHLRSARSTPEKNPSLHHHGADDVIVGAEDDAAHSLSALRDMRLQRLVQKSPPRERDQIILKARCFRRWRQNIRLQKTIRIKEGLKWKKATSFQALTSLIKHFLAWRNHIARTRMLAEALWRYHALRKGFAALRWAVQRKKFARQHLECCKRKLKLTKCFNTWREKYSFHRLGNLRSKFMKWKNRCRNKVIVDLFRTRRERFSTLQAFFFWSEKFHESRQLRVAVGHYRIVISKKIWHLWRIYTAESIVHKSQMEVAEIKHESSVLSTCMGRWRTTTVRLLYARMHHNRKTLGFTMKGWKQSTLMLATEHQKEKRIAHELRRRHLLRLHFKNWVRERKVVGVRNKIIKRNKRCCMLIWKSQLQKYRVIGAEIASHHEQMLLGRSLQAMMEYVRNQQRRRRESLVHMKRMTLQRNLSAWHSFTLRKMKLRNMQKTLYLRTEKARMRSLFQNWKERLQVIQTAHMQRHQWTMKCVRKAAGKWMKILERKKMKRIFFSEINKRRKKVLKVHFTKWRRQLDHENRRQEKADVYKVMLWREKIRRFMHAWNLRAKESATMRPLIKRLNRKRITRFFDAWLLLRNRRVTQENMSQQISENHVRECFLIWKGKYDIINKMRLAEDEHKLAVKRRAYRRWTKYADRCRNFVKVSEQQERSMMLQAFNTWATKTTFKQIVASKNVQQHFTTRANAHKILLRWRAEAEKKKTNEKEAVDWFRQRRDLCSKRSRFRDWVTAHWHHRVAVAFAMNMTQKRLKEILLHWRNFARQNVEEGVERFSSCITSLRQKAADDATLQKWEMHSRGTQSDHDVTIPMLVLNDITTQTFFDTDDVIIDPLGNARSHNDNASDTIDWVRTSLAIDTKSKEDTEEDSDGQSYSISSPKVLDTKTSNHKYASTNSDVCSILSSMSTEDEFLDSEAGSIVMTTGCGDSGVILLRDYVSTATSMADQDEIASVTSSKLAVGQSDGLQSRSSSTDSNSKAEVLGSNPRVNSYPGNGKVTHPSHTPCQEAPGTQHMTKSCQTKSLPSQNSCQKSSSKISETTLPLEEYPFMQPILCDLSHMSTLPILNIQVPTHKCENSGAQQGTLLVTLKHETNRKQNGDLQPTNTQYDLKCKGTQNGALRNTLQNGNGQACDETEYDTPQRTTQNRNGAPSFWTKDGDLQGSITQMVDKKEENGEGGNSEPSPKQDAKKRQRPMPGFEKQSQKNTGASQHNGLHSYSNSVSSSSSPRKGFNSTEATSTATPKLHETTANRLETAPKVLYGYGDAIEKAEVVGYRPKRDTGTDSSKEQGANHTHAGFESPADITFDPGDNYEPEHPIFSSTLRDQSTMMACGHPSGNEDERSVDAHSTGTSGESEAEGEERSTADSETVSSIVSSNDGHSMGLEPESQQILAKKPRPVLPIHPWLKDPSIPVTEWLVRLAVIRMKYRPLAFAFHQWKLLIHAKRWEQEMLSHMKKRRRLLATRQYFRTWMMRQFQARLAANHRSRVFARKVYREWAAWAKKRASLRKMRLEADEADRLRAQQEMFSLWKEKTSRKLALLEILKYWQSRAIERKSPRSRNEKALKRYENDLIDDCFLTWTLRTKQSQFVKKFKDNKSRRRCFDAWREWSVQRAATKRRCEEARAYNLKRKYFNAWRRKIVLMKRIKAMRKRCVRTWVSALLRRWCEHSEAKLHQNVAISRIASLNRHKTTGACFSRWNDELTKRKVADIMFRRNLVRKYVREWRGVTEDLVRDKENTQAVTDMVAMHSKHDILKNWRNEVLLRRKLENSLEEKKHLVVRRIWDKWIEAVGMKKSTKTYRGFLKRRSFNAWRRFTQQRKKANDKTRLVVLRWHALTTRNKQLAIIADQFCSSARTLAIEIGFNTWIVAYEQTVKAKIHHKTVVIKRTFAALLYWTRHKNSLKKMQMNFQGQRLKELTAFSWHKWRHYYRLKVSNAKVIQIHQVAVLHRCLNKYWLLWRRRQLEAQANRTYDKTLMQKCLTKWKEQHDELVRADRMVENHQTRRLSKILTSWHGVAALKMSERRIILDLSQTRTEILMLSVFMTWVKQFKKKKIACSYWEQKTLQKSFDRLKIWKEENSRVQMCYVKAVRSIENLKLKFYFYQWVHVFRKVRMMEVTCDQLLETRDRGLVKKCWKKWFRRKEKRDIQRRRSCELAHSAGKKWRDYAAKRIAERQIREERVFAVERFQKIWICRRAVTKWRREFRIHQFRHNHEAASVQKRWNLWSLKTTMMMYAREIDSVWTLRRHWHLWRLEHVTKQATNQAQEQANRDLQKIIFRIWRAYCYRRKTGKKLHPDPDVTKDVTLTPRKQSRIPRPIK